MKPKFILLSMLLFCMPGILLAKTAQTWEPPVLEATEIQDGLNYYVLNTGLNLRLAAGADWNSRAILNEEGLPAIVRFDAATNLYVLEFTKVSRTLYRSNLEGDVYTDRDSENKWNIQPVDGEDLTYTIQAPSTAGGYNANQYFGSTGQREGDHYILRYNRDKDQYGDYIKWQFLDISLYEARLTLYNALVYASESTTLDLSSYTTVYETSTNLDELRDAATELDGKVFAEIIKDASPDNPVDLTYYLANPSFESNDARGWTMETGGSVNYQEVEFYGKTINMYQEVTGFPAGKYILKAQGFERPQDDAGVAYRAGTETIYARLYAKSEIFPEASIPFNSVYKYPYSGEGTHNGYVAGMSSAARAFAEGLYEMELAEIMLAEDDVLTIGAKSDFKRPAYWVMFDNFRILYLGFDQNELVTLVQQQIDVAQAIKDDKMQNIVKGNLTSALEQLEGILDAEPLELNDLYGAYNQLLVAIGAANVSILAYDDLQTAIDSAWVVYDNGAGNEASAFQNSINAAEGMTNNLDAELDAIYDSTSDVYKAIFAYRLANATGTAPRVMTNPNYVRGSTSILARLLGGATSDVLERGFCWATHPNPTVLDNRTTDCYDLIAEPHYDMNGIIYHIKDLEPSTVYYIRTYAVNKTYAVGYGDVLKVITIPKGNVTYTLHDDNLSFREGVETAVYYFNNFTSIQNHNLSVSYAGDGSVGAHASYGGWMELGSGVYHSPGLALHEMGHTVGVGTHWMWGVMRDEDGFWYGDRGNKVVQFFRNMTNTKLHGDNTHMGPYGVNGPGAESGRTILYMANAAVHQAMAEDGLPPTGGFGLPAYTLESEDSIKYYIKIENERLGRNTMYLVENPQGNLALKVMSGEEALANDSAAWHFIFNLETCYYTIRNASTGKYFTYRKTGTNGITLVDKATPGAAENFQLMMSRVNSVIGSGKDKLTTRTFWIIRPEHRTDPPTLSAQTNRSVTVINFNWGDNATTQRWFVLKENEVELFDKAYPQTSQTDEMVMSQLTIYAENQQLHINNIIEPSDIVVYDISGRLQFSMNGVSGSCSRPLSEGVYFVSVSNKQAIKTKKVVVR